MNLRRAGWLALSVSLTTYGEVMANECRDFLIALTVYEALPAPTGKTQAERTAQGVARFEALDRVEETAASVQASIDDEDISRIIDALEIAEANIFSALMMKCRPNCTETAWRVADEAFTVWGAAGDARIQNLKLFCTGED